tara:strand:- start:1678 stop:2100 length:423 start_codon:yes stop_codon:yes gene_type:complete
MSNSKTAVTIKGQLVGYKELSTTSVKLWDKEGRLLHNNNDINDAFISKFFLNQFKTNIMYRKLNKTESEILENISCQEEMDVVLSGYTLEVFKVTTDFEGMYGVSFYVSDGTADQLTVELNRDNTIQDFAFAYWRTTRMK